MEETKTEEPTPNFLEEVKALRDEMHKQIVELKELRANDILSGKVDAPTEKEKPAEITPLEYANAAQKGIILNGKI